MLRVTLRTARATAARLVAAGLAIVVGTAFVAAVLLAADLMNRTVAAAASTSYRGADVVVGYGTGGTDGSSPSYPSAVMVARIAALPQVAGADGRRTTNVEIPVGAGFQFATVTGVPTTAALRPRDVVDGRLPVAPGEVALDAATAAEVRAAVGSRLTAQVTLPTPLGGADGQTPVTRALLLTVVGIVDDPTSSAFGSSPDVWAWPADVDAWAAASSGEALDDLPLDDILVVARPPTTPDALRAAVVGATGDGVAVRTADEQGQQAVTAFTGRVNLLTGVLLAFAALALVVAALVITNTFAVLVAARARHLALLRCVGASRRQVRAGVLVEALALGLVASGAGVLAGTGIAALAAAVLHDRAPGIPVPATVHPGLLRAAVPLVAGTVVTVLAALVPARAATRVSPLAALRPAQAPDLRRRGSRLRLAASVVLVVGGGSLLVAGVLVARLPLSGDLAAAGVALAVPGGAISFVGVLLAGVFYVPRLVAAGGRLADLLGGGATARVATTNAVRNPRRTAATTGALLIGVTLITLMTVGAATASATLTSSLGDRFPVDVTVGSPVDGIGVLDDVDDAGRAQALAAQPAALDGEVLRAVGAVDGVAAAVPLTAARAQITAVRTVAGDGDTAGDGSDTEQPGETSTAVVTVEGVDPAGARRVVRSPDLLSGLAPGHVVLPPWYASLLGIRPGDPVTLTVGARSARVRAEVPEGGTGDLGDAVLATRADVAALAPRAPTALVWASLAPGARAAGVVSGVQRAVTAASPAAGSAPAVAGAAVERASYEKVVDTLLLVVVALIAVAVLIALIGVTNTLSLSVIERTRESAVLRALGMTRGRLRAALALEAVLITGVGVVLGVVLGTLYGWAGAVTLLPRTLGGDGGLVLPVGQLVAVAGVCLAAGLAASVLPARRAVRVSPVAALAE